MKTVSPYRTAAELGIADWEHQGLVALVGPLSRAELRFDMRTAGHIAACGTVACIGGHMAMALGMSSIEARRYVDGYRRVEGWPEQSLTPLFFPNLPNAWGCSAEQACAAVVNFLTLGAPRWDDLMRGSAPAG